MTAYSVGNSNLFAYCGNNPVYYKDLDGNWIQVAVSIGVGAVLGGLGEIIDAAENNRPIDWKIVARDSFVGAISAVPGLKMVGVILTGAFTIMDAKENDLTAEETISRTVIAVATEIMPLDKVFSGPIERHVGQAVYSVFSSTCLASGSQTNNSPTSKSTSQQGSLQKVYRYVNGKLVARYVYL